MFEFLCGLGSEEIRFTRALRALDTVPRDSTWDTPGLWTKYDQAMQDPTLVQPGWTNPRTLTPGADPLQRAVITSELLTIWVHTQP